MACHLDGVKPLSETMLEYFTSTPRNKSQWNFIWNSNIFIAESTFENVICDMLSISSGLNVLMTVP